MRPLWTVFRKELTDALRDRRMLLVSFVVMPLAVPLILAGVSAAESSRRTEQLEGTLELPVVGIDRAPNLVVWLVANDVRVEAAPADPDAAVRAQEHEVILRIDASYAADWRAGRPARLELVYDSSRPLQSGTSIARVRGLLET